jgi:hypothetical protein
MTRNLRMRCVSILAMICMLVGATEAAPLGAGGGFLSAGIRGDYFDNPSLSGTPRFSRKDDRIDFDFGTDAAPGGSSSPGFRDIGATNWSVRWNGVVIPRFSETYTFTTTSAGGAILFIKTSNSRTWTTLTSDWTPHSVMRDTATFAMNSGERYDIQLEYCHLDGPAEIGLHWSSASVPDEAIEPVLQMGLNGEATIDYDPGQVFADAMKTARLSSWKGEGGAGLDANGWPMGDGFFYLYAGQPADVNGTWTMTFTGRAVVTLALDPISGLSNRYDAAANRSTVTFINHQNAEKTSGTLSVTLSHTRRLPTDRTATGITDIAFMRPTSPGSAASYAAGTLFTEAYKALHSKFTAIRFMDALSMNCGDGSSEGANNVKEWSDLLRPGYSSQAGFAGGYQGRGVAIPYAVELCNETGCDAWINIPPQASDDFVTKLAQGLKYGFDAEGMPYASEHAGPIYPPLNSNLRAYLELSNEMWNWSFRQTGLVASIAAGDVNAKNADGQILNYDNINDPNVWTRRWTILRSKQISDLFRGVWGDGFMMTRIRPVFMYQYNNINNTAADALQFLDNYFNDTNGTHVQTPHPVNYFLFAAGGGWYNSVNSATGLGEVTVPNGDFATPVLPPSSSRADPSDASWIFQGTAGMVSNNTNIALAASGTTPGATLKPPTDAPIGVGCKFKMAANTYLYQIGRYVSAGNKGSHVVRLFDSDKNKLAEASVNTEGHKAGEYVYASVGPIQLVAGRSYYLVSEETRADSDDAFCGEDTVQTIAGGITIQNAVSVAMPEPSWDEKGWRWTDGPAGNHVSGPVTFKFATGPVADVGYPPDAIEGTQSGYLHGSGSISQTLNFPAQASDVTFFAAQGESGEEKFVVSIDGVPLPQGWDIPFAIKENHYIFVRVSHAVNLTAGPHLLRFAGQGNGTVFIDAVKVESADAMLKTGVMDLGPTVRSEVDWDLAYGLRTAGYEGGFEVGGDNPIPASLAANVDARVRKATAATLESYICNGGDLPIVFNAVGGAYAVAMTSPLGIPNVYRQETPKMAAYQAALSALPMNPSNATTLPATLTPGNLSLFFSDSENKTYADSGGNIYLNSGWLDWNVVAPTSGAYAVEVNTSGAGGAFVMTADEVPVASGTGGQTLNASMTLTAGLHAIKVRGTADAAFKVSGIAVTQEGAPTPPSIRSHSLANGTATLNWAPVGGATKYFIGWGLGSGQYSRITDVGNGTQGTISGLDPVAAAYVVVYACSASGARSLPSAQCRLAPRSSDPRTLITFEDQPVTPQGEQNHLTEPLFINGFAFTSFGTSGGKALQIQDGSRASNWPGNWSSKVLESAFWGASHRMVRADGRPFDLHSLDVGELQSQSAVITGYDTGGGTISSVVNFPKDGAAHTSHVVLDWVDVIKVEVSWYEGTNGAGGGRDGCVDNLVLDGEGNGEK